MLGAVISFVLVLAVLILVHEWGHFFAAKKQGTRVDEFGFGFPPRIIAKKRGETLYSLNLLPLGGFVKIYGEGGEGENDPKSFASLKIFGKLKVILAGVLMNLFLAFFIFTLINIFGITKDPSNIFGGYRIKDQKIYIVHVSKDSPAEEKFAISDEVSEADNIKVRSLDEFRKYVFDNRGKEIEFKIKREGKVLSFKASSRLNPPKGQGPLGVGLIETAKVSYPFYIAPFASIYDMVIASKEILQGLYSLFKTLFSEGRVAEELSGPVGIAALTGKISKFGFLSMLQFIGVLSLNLFWLNLLPIPALDGGRALFIVLSRKKKINIRFEKTAHAIGFAILLLVIIYITIRDITRLMS